MFVEELISIKESVRQLDEKFPHLKDVTWNDTEDRRSRFQKRLEEKKKENELGIESDYSKPTAIQAFVFWD